MKQHKTHARLQERNTEKTTKRSTRNRPKRGISERKKNRSLKERHNSRNWKIKEDAFLEHNTINLVKLTGM